jgi:response regulator RpfG family c-di-GMP phosphodiesterase
MQPEPKVNILLIDDQPKNLQTMEVKLIRESLAQNLLKAHSGKAGVTHNDSVFRI